MTVSAGVSIAFLVVLAGAGFAVQRRLWHQEWPQFERQAAWWPLGSRLWRGWVRSYGVVAAACAIAAPTCLWSELDGGMSDAEGAVMFVLLLGPWLVAVSVALFNRPKRFVAPRMRKEPGALFGPAPPDGPQRPPGRRAVRYSSTEHGRWGD